MTFVQARWFYKGRSKAIRLIVVHCTVSPEMGTGAEDVARYFANLPVSNKASAHRVGDSDSEITCVNDEDTAFAAAGANSDGLHYELVGRPEQTRAEWLDQYSTLELATALPTVRGWSEKYGIPLRWLTVEEVADGVTKGVTDHATVSAAFPKVSTGHWDPGPNFPRDIFPVPDPHPAPLPEEFMQYTYVKKPDAAEVYVARKGEKPVHVGDKTFGYADAEALAQYQGDKVIASPAGVDVDDQQGQTRKVLVLESAESRAWFGL